MLRKALVLLGTASVAGAIALVPTAAQAAPAGCQSGALCGFTGYYFSGSVGNLHGNNTNLLYSPWTSVESVYNDGTMCSVNIYTGTSYSGSNVTIPIGYQYGDLQNDAPAYYHHIQSNHWC